MPISSDNLYLSTFKRHNWIVKIPHRHNKPDRPQMRFIPLQICPFHHWSLLHLAYLEPSYSPLDPHLSPDVRLVCGRSRLCKLSSRSIRTGPPVWATKPIQLVTGSRSNPLPETGSAPALLAFALPGQNRTRSAVTGLWRNRIFYDEAFMFHFMVAFVCLTTIYGKRWFPIRQNRSEAKLLLELIAGLL